PTAQESTPRGCALRFSLSGYRHPMESNAMCRIPRTNFLRTWLFVTLLVALLRVQARPQAAAVPAPPPTPVEEKTDTIHGVSVSDPYQWLEDASSPSVRSWIAAQQKYTA